MSQPEKVSFYFEICELRKRIKLSDKAPILQLYVCEHRLCQGDQYLRGLNEVIEHLRKKHKLSFIKRPKRLGDSDGHGHVWYCDDCETNWGKNHRSFGSSKAIWDHLNRCHSFGYGLDKIKLEI